MVITIANTTKRVKANTLNAPAHSIGSPKLRVHPHRDIDERRIPGGKKADYPEQDGKYHPHGVRRTFRSVVLTFLPFLQKHEQK